MRTFRVYLVALILLLGAYTLVVGLNHGWNLLPVFFGDMAAMTWPGQFNADFMTFLSLSGLWIAWRHHCPAGGVALGLVAGLGAGPAGGAGRGIRRVVRNTPPAQGV